MKYILPFVIVLQTYRASMIFLRKYKNSLELTLETLILFCLTFFELLRLNGARSSLSIEVILVLYITFKTNYEFIKKPKHISILSIKNAIDASKNGVIFFKGNKVILINSTMEEILKSFHIEKDIIKNLSKIKEKFIKCNNNVYQLKIDSKEIMAIDITDLYELQEEQKRKNDAIEEANKKMIDYLDNIEEIEKEKNLIKIKNEFHDLLGQRLTLFVKSLENNINIADAEFILDNLFDESKENLNDLVKLYKAFGININVKGDFNDNEILFEAIREGITNAIIHSNATNIDIIVTKREIIVKNKLYKQIDSIVESEGIKGIRRKLNDIGWSLSIDFKDDFVLKMKAD